MITFVLLPVPNVAVTPAGQLKAWRAAATCAPVLAFAIEPVFSVKPSTVTEYVPVAVETEELVVPIVIVAVEAVGTTDEAVPAVPSTVEPLYRVIFWKFAFELVVFWATVRSVIFTFSTLEVSAKRNAAKLLPVEPMTRRVDAGEAESRPTESVAPVEATVRFWPSVVPVQETALYETKLVPEQPVRDAAGVRLLALERMSA